MGFIFADVQKKVISLWVKKCQTAIQKNEERRSGVLNANTPEECKIGDGQQVKRGAKHYKKY